MRRESAGSSSRAGRRMVAWADDSSPLVPFFNGPMMLCRLSVFACREQNGGIAQPAERTELAGFNVVAVWIGAVADRYRRSGHVY